MNRLAALTPKKLQVWSERAKQQAKTGRLPDYIPLLQEADPTWFSLSIITVEHQMVVIGDRDRTFPLMSVIKPFLLFYLLSHLGTEAVFKHVGRKPSPYPFNSLTQLQADGGFPRNPMINSGAITLASLLPAKDTLSRCENLCLWLNNHANCQLFLDEAMLASVQSIPNLRNQALAKELTSQGYLKDAAMALETYEYICCLTGTIIDLARLGLLLVECPSSLLIEHSQLVQELMITCGLYEASKTFIGQVRLPSKSGVSGAILSIVPNQGAIAIYSPPLDSQGNSVAG
ncbi:MAG: glutaminase, partial [Hydrococcus sp. RM1_1_31]|nr:glutaminase [Hydrococcus sp. RM1_1_31]